MIGLVVGNFSEEGVDEVTNFVHADKLDSCKKNRENSVSALATPQIVT